MKRYDGSETRTFHLAIRKVSLKQVMTPAIRMSVLPILVLFGVLMTGSVQGYVTYKNRYYNSRTYYISNERERFSLTNMNIRCKNLGGYLAKIDSKDEDNFLSSFVYRAGGKGPFFTGITDLASEGRFYNYHDNTPAKYLSWRWFQPDNWWNEDCVAIWIHGLNDRKCGIYGRYICEVPK
ncbi:perlucin [Plakobranchus ocellatus]|uniref:Perlucin n=1 Tax=Plakobranchus ocellatus TaxID=259542 RepID=A0AAV4CSY6_9GAST|nr:perlucin [Plakobranchus ocellatus]